VPDEDGNFVAPPLVVEVDEPFLKPYLRLRPGSPAQDAADAAHAPAADIDHQLRDDGAPDVGADEL
jgi:hypothetical protein